MKKGALILKRRMRMMLALAAVAAALWCGSALADKSCGEHVTWTVSRTGVLTISGTGATYDYEMSRTKLSPFHGSAGAITSIVIQDGVTGIGNYLFLDLTNVTSVTLPASVASIGQYAFYRCTGLTSVSIMNPNAAIGDTAFSGCSRLTTIYGRKDSTAAVYAHEHDLGFSILDVLTGSCGMNVTWTLDMITHELTISGTGAMREYDNGKSRPWYDYRDSITSVSIDSGVTHICDDAFSGFSCLTDVTIPASVTSIGFGAFASCTSLTGITIPNSVASIGESAFSYCSSLASIKLPDSLTRIAKYTFEFCTSLTSISIPDNVTVIDMEAFQSCEHLASVTISDSVTSIGERAFVACLGLKNLRIGNSVAYIGKMAFDACESLTSVTFPQSVIDMNDRTFVNCTKLAHVTFYNKNTKIDSAFAFTALYGGGTIHGWEGSTAQAYAAEHSSITFEPLGSISGACGANVTYSFDSPTGVLTISGSGAMADCISYTDAPWFAHRYAVRSVSIGNGVTVIGDYAFIESDNMTSVVIPGSVTRIGRSAFAGCGSLGSASIQSKVTSIGDFGFYGCGSLRQVFIQNTNITIGEYAFDECPGLIICGHSGSNAQTYAKKHGIPFALFAKMASADFTLPAAMTRIEAEAFLNAKMTVVYIPDGITFLGSRAFAGCTGLTQIRIPASITAIPADVFQGINKSNLTIFGMHGSAAETFANDAGIRFNLIP